jgi:predicted component of type VI protein secretion system
VSFFGKLAAAHEEPLTASIARNLEAVLNAKQGHSAAVEVFGLGRYDSPLAERPLVAALTAEMLAQIRRFEPRLRDPVLALVGRDRELWVCFSLTGSCEGRPCGFSVLFHSIFRHVRVSPTSSA